MRLWRTELRICLSRFLGATPAMCGWSMGCKACLLGRQSSSRPFLRSGLSTNETRFKEKENNTMPLIRVDAFEGRSDAEIKTLLDGVHRAAVKALHIPER